MPRRQTPETTPEPASTSDAVEIPRKAWAEWRHARKQEKAWKEIAARKRAVLEKLIGSRTQATIDGISVITWRETEKINKFDADSFKKDHPDLYQQYMVKKPGTRPFNETDYADELDGDDDD